MNNIENGRKKTKTGDKKDKHSGKDQILLAFIERRLSAANTVMHNLQGAESKDSYKLKHRPDHTNHKSSTLQISRPQYVLLEGQQLPLGGGSDVRLHLRGATP